MFWYRYIYFYYRMVKCFWEMFIVDLWFSWSIYIYTLNIQYCIHISHTVHSHYKLLNVLNKDYLFSCIYFNNLFIRFILIWRLVFYLVIYFHLYYQINLLRINIAFHLSPSSLIYMCWISLICTVVSRSVSKRDTDLRVVSLVAAVGSFELGESLILKLTNPW